MYFCCCLKKLQFWFLVWRKYLNELFLCVLLSEEVTYSVSIFSIRYQENILAHVCYCLKKLQNWFMVLVSNIGKIFEGFFFFMYCCLKELQIRFLFLVSDTKKIFECIFCYWLRSYNFDFCSYCQPSGKYLNIFFSLCVIAWRSYRFII